MSLFNKKVKGVLGYYRLSDWWINELHEEERKIILSKYQPMGLPADDLIHGNVSYASQSRLSFISTMASWFTKPEYYQMANKIIAKADGFVSETKSVTDIHYHYQNKLEIYYRNRNTEDDALNKAIESCKQQIALSIEAVKIFMKEYGSHLPRHKGYEQLAIIYEKQQYYDQAINLCKVAMEQGWSGDWQKRIGRITKKKFK